MPFNSLALDIYSVLYYISSSWSTLKMIINKACLLQAGGSIFLNQCDPQQHRKKHTHTHTQIGTRCLTTEIEKTTLDNHNNKSRLLRQHHWSLFTRSSCCLAVSLASEDQRLSLHAVSLTQHWTFRGFSLHGVVTVLLYLWCRSGEIHVLLIFTLSIFSLHKSFSMTIPFNWNDSSHPLHRLSLKCSTAVWYSAKARQLVPSYTIRHERVNIPTSC